VSAERTLGLDLNQVASPILEYITSPGCSDCRQFEELITQVQPDFPSLEVHEVAGETPRGLEVSVGRGILRFPIIVLDDEIIGIEAMTEDALRRALVGRMRIG
jgi:glutaredoxin